MQFELERREVVSAGVLASASFGMDEEDAPHVFGVLHGTLYSDKELALLREYGVNAWDEHQDAGIPDRPIKVILPTEVEPTLVVRDFGRGLSEEWVFGVYNRYGKSTKRSSPTTAGFLGIGSKAAFAYTDSFTIVSRHGGVRATYVAVLGENHVGRCDKYTEEPLEEGEETGVEIRIAVDPKDVPAFHRAAERLFRHFRPLPEINIPLKPPEYEGREHGYVLGPCEDEDGASQWTAVVGVVPYRLDLSKMSRSLEEAGLYDVAKRVRGGLYFGLDEGVAFAAHREEVAYTGGTKKAVVRKLRQLVDEIVADLHRVTSDPDASSWARRMAAQSFKVATRLAVPAAYRDWEPEMVTLYSWDERLTDGDGNLKRGPDGRYVYDVPRTFRVQGFPYRKSRWGGYEGVHVTRLTDWADIEVLPTTRLLVRDTSKPFRWYRPTVDDHLVVPTGDHTVEEVEAELAEWVAKAKVDGVPVLRLSSLPVDEKAPKTPRATAGKTSNPKHVQRHFVLNENIRTDFPWSENWTVQPHVPADDDVFVVLSHFRPVGDFYGTRGFYQQLRRDRHHVALMGGTFPAVVGYKTLVKDPVHSTRLKGTPYAEWRKRVLPELLARSPNTQAVLVHFEWRTAHSHMRSPGIVANVLEALAKAGFGPDHHLVRLYARFDAAYKALEALQKPDRDKVRLLHQDLGLTHSDVATQVASAYQRYPLFCPGNHGPDFGVVVGSAAEPWLAYIRSVDREAP